MGEQREIKKASMNCKNIYRRKNQRVKWIVNLMVVNISLVKNSFSKTLRKK